MKIRAHDWSSRSYAAVSRAKVGQKPGKYRTACMKMPGLVHQSGLLQALVFVVARDEQGRQYVDDVARTLNDKNGDHTALIERAQQCDLPQYLALSRDVMEVAQWFRRFAQVELRDAEDADAE